MMDIDRRPRKAGAMRCTSSKCNDNLCFNIALKPLFQTHVSTELAFLTSRLRTLGLRFCKFPQLVSKTKRMWRLDLRVDKFG